MLCAAVLHTMSLNQMLQIISCTEIVFNITVVNNNVVIELNKVTKFITNSFCVCFNEYFSYFSGEFLCESQT